MQRLANLATIAAALVTSFALQACDESTEAAELQLNVATAPLPAEAITTDLGYSVEVATLQLALSGVYFTEGGEVHTADSSVIAKHPGHSQGGLIIAELTGERVFDFAQGQNTTVGAATFLAGNYDGANFVYGRQTSIGEDDAAVSVTMSGTIARDGVERPFTAELVQDDGSEVIGVPFSARVNAHDEGNTVLFRFEAVDPIEDDTAFDGNDFFVEYPGTEGIVIRSGDDAHNRLRRTLRSHDHFTFSLAADQR